MSGRGASAAVISEVALSANRPFHLFEIYLDGITARSTDAYRDITWGGNNYSALGHFLEYSNIEETTDLQVNSVKLTQSGVDQSYISLFLGYNYIDRRMVIRKAFLDTNLAVIVDPLPIFDGRCDAPEINENPDDGTCTVTFSAASHWVDFERRPGRHTNHEEQQIWFPGDLGFEYVAQVSSKELKWGK